MPGGIHDRDLLLIRQLAVRMRLRYNVFGCTMYNNRFNSISHFIGGRTSDIHYRSVDSPIIQNLHIHKKINNRLLWKKKSCTITKRCITDSGTSEISAKGNEEKNKQTWALGVADHIEHWTLLANHVPISYWNPNLNTCFSPFFAGNLQMYRRTYVTTHFNEKYSIRSACSNKMWVLNIYAK